MSIANVLGVGVAVLVALFVGLNLWIRLRSKAMEGKPLPDVPGPIGKKLTRAKHALVYFMSPGCAACRPLTPQVQKLSKSNSNVFVVDVTHHLDVARALHVMATPSTVEIEQGRIVKVHVGSLPAEVLGRFAH